ncbi:hypothetical protein EQV96_16205 [Pseudomonas sp. TMW22080]|nr:hypothetical protein [Pseudomonas sp. TMW22080]
MKGFTTHSINLSGVGRFSSGSLKTLWNKPGLCSSNKFLVWERACSRWHQRGHCDRPRRLHREQARSHIPSLMRFIPVVAHAYFNH